MQTASAAFVVEEVCVTELIFLHGSQGHPDDWGDFPEIIAPKARYLIPTGTITDGSGYTFVERSEEGGFDPENLKRRAAALLEALPAAAKDVRQVIVGYSRGAAMAQALMLVAPRRFSAAVLIRPEPVCETFDAALCLPVLILAGRHDVRRRISDAETLSTALKKAGAFVTVQWLECGHGWSPDSADASHARAFLQRYLG